MNKERYVTGANGFVGRHLTARFADFTAIPHQDIETTHLSPCSEFYFMSTYGNMADHTDDGRILQANISDLVHIVREIDFKDLDSFVFISSSSVRLKYQTMYSRTKRAAEELMLAFAEKYNAPVCIVRPYSVTGVGEQQEHLIPKLIDSCLNGTPMPLVPNAVHDFIDVEDLVDGIQNLTANRAKGIFELGSGVGHTNQEVREIVEHVTGKKAKVDITGSMRMYDNEDWVCRHFAAQTWGWKPRKTLERSIEEMVEAYKHAN